jgi:hypothetical protein
MAGRAHPVEQGVALLGHQMMRLRPSMEAGTMWRPRVWCGSCQVQRAALSG